MAAEVIHVHVFVSGRVQGVGYRVSTYRMALQLGLKGWVKNLADGRVEAVFEGEKMVVDRMLEWCRQGPIGSIVKDVAINYGHLENFEDFEIRK
jgi:acylphosphatase